jgi:hypothetical protein
MKMEFKASPISSAAKEVLGQMFLSGPIWDGNLVSKAGRSDLVAAGLAFQVNGFTSLTPEGVRVAIEWKDFHQPLTDWSRRWLHKAGGG